MYKQEFKQLMKMSYSQLVDYLLYKYGPVKGNYFTNDSFVYQNKKIKRTSEGLFIHHIDEDKAIDISSKGHAQHAPKHFQNADRLVYCNFLEHLLMHIAITTEVDHVDKIPGNWVGYGGLSLISRPLNDLFGGRPTSQEWLNKCFSIIKENFDEYIECLARIYWVENAVNSTFGAETTVENSVLKVTCGWYGDQYDNLYNALLPLINSGYKIDYVFVKDKVRQMQEKKNVFETSITEKVSSFSEQMKNLKEIFEKYK